ncbi:MAG: hypothetical protein DCC71_05355 [Proteobacteria bacterium]|nr:MAG: hypothetical protein DCC71_05355 [Pseudomonadota bacterium]
MSGTSCTVSGTHTIDHLCTLDWSGYDATIAKGAKLTTATGNAYSISAGSLTVLGTLQAVEGSIDVTTTGDFAVQVSSNSAAAVDIKQGGSFDATVGGNATLAGKVFDASGTGGVDGGSIAIDADGSITVSQTVDASGGGEWAYGGSIDLTGASITTTGLLKAIGTQDGDGGEVNLTATGACNVNGAINVSSSGEWAWGGAITVDCGSLSTSSAWDTSGGTEGVGGDIDVTTSGAATSTSSSSWTCTAGGGGDGCWVTVSGGGDVTIGGDINASATGTDASGGAITIGSSAGDVTVGATSLLQADVGSGGWTNGTIDIGPACNVEIDGVLDTRTSGVGGGNNSVSYRNSFDGTAATLRADDSPDGNTIHCPCVDANADLVCDTPLACAVAPSTSGGTYQPAPTLAPMLLTACP